MCNLYSITNQAAIIALFNGARAPMRRNMKACPRHCPETISRLIEIGH
jgi:hypothetical protein